MADCKVTNKTQWPELVGVKGDVAVATIKAEKPTFDVFTIKKGTKVTMEYLSNRESHPNHDFHSIELISLPVWASTGWAYEPAQVSK
ncbi:hypothetical protein QJS04_geneDACA013103 [Acorus gramineus]|uniref:Uncharacterized protein n=1 Tax=Acorus gramineus TaxID=55184 RepID=A0AAV9B255_ACOGR|nr:hypothetical protein QJS04_geneDACA013103 [Acorus gramineus]